MNAGAYGSETKDVLLSATVLTPEGQVKRIPAEELELGYRTSCIPGKGYVVLEAEYALKRGEPEAIKARMDELSAKRREKQPLEYPSAGSTFKRPQGHFAGQLIQEAGLKGFTLGGAAVSEKHAGFVINQNGATASEILRTLHGGKKTGAGAVRSGAGAGGKTPGRILGGNGRETDHCYRHVGRGQIDGAEIF